MKISLYLSTAIISTITLGGNVWAQCVTTQDCTALGYTESSCPNNQGVKCPFGDKWFCASTEITPEQCTELGFTLTCTGTGETAAGPSPAPVLEKPLPVKLVTANIIIALVQRTLHGIQQPRHARRMRPTASSARCIIAMVPAHKIKSARRHCSVWLSMRKELAEMVGL